MRLLVIILALAILSSASCGTEPDGPTGDTNVSSPAPDAGSNLDASSSSDADRPNDGGNDTTDMADDSDASADMSTDLDADAETDAATPGSCTDPFQPVIAPATTPPFSGTAFVTDELITPQDPSSFVDVTYQGTGSRQMFDRRIAQFITVDAHLFDAQFGQSTIVEVQVNPEFDRAQAETEARKYAEAVGRLPSFLFRDLETMWIHAGVELFGGGNRNILIHTGQGDNYGASLEEILIHEAVHTSVDAYHRDESRWADAKSADRLELSTYARDNPDREDLAESVGPYLAVRFGRNRVSAATIATIEQTIPNRIQYFDCQGWTMDIVQ